jgi:hypothetical protein
MFQEFGCSDLPTLEAVERRRVCAEQLRAYRADLVLVDIDLPTFARLESSVCAALGTRVWTLARWMPEQWWTAHRIAFENSLHFGARLIMTEPCAGLGPLTPGVGRIERVEPIVTHNLDEMYSQEDSYETLGKRPYARIGALIHAGIPGEINELAAKAEADGVFEDCTDVMRFDWWNDRVRIRPTALLGACERIVSAAGYNRFWETRWLGLGPLTTLYPLLGARGYDDQGERVRATPAAYQMKENGADQLARMIAEVL